MKRQSLLGYKILIIFLLFTILVFGSGIIYLLIHPYEQKQENNIKDVEIDDNLILSLLYGKDSVFSQEEDKNTGEVFWSVLKGDTHISVIEKIKNEKENLSYIVFLLRRFENCGHADSNSLDGAIISYQGGEWIFEKFENIGQVGNFCSRPQHDVINIGPDMQGVVFHDMYANHGYLFNWDTIYYFYNGEFYKTDNIRTYVDNRGNCPPLGGTIEPCSSLTTIYKLIPGDNPVFYDIEILTRGTIYNPDNDIVENYHEQKTTYPFINFEGLNSQNN